MPDAPGTKPATNGRSPNRKPRYRSVANAELTRAEQERFLRAYTEFGYAYALAAVRKTQKQVWKWAEQHPDFLAKWRSAKVARQTLQAPEITSLTNRALNIVSETMDDTNEDARLRFEAAKTHLQGTGVYSARQQQEISGKDGQPLVVNVISAIPRPLAEEKTCLSQPK